MIEEILERGEEALNKKIKDGKIPKDKAHYRPNWVISKHMIDLREKYSEEEDSQGKNLTSWMNFWY